MSRSIFPTPEEFIKRKQLRKKIIYISIMLGTAVLSALVTILSNQLVQ